MESVEISVGCATVDRQVPIDRVRPFRLGLLTFSWPYLFLAAGSSIFVYYACEELQGALVEKVTLPSPTCDPRWKEYATDQFADPCLINFIRAYPEHNLLVAVTDYGNLFLLDTQSLNITMCYESVRNSAWSCAYNPKYGLFAVGSNSHNIDIFNTCHVAGPVMTLREHGNNIPALEFSRDNELLVSCSVDSHIFVYNIVSGFQRISSIQFGLWAWNVMFSMSREYVVVANSVELVLIRNDNIVDIFDLCEDECNHEVMRRISFIKYLDEDYFVAFEQYCGAGALMRVDLKRRKLALILRLNYLPAQHVINDSNTMTGYNLFLVGVTVIPLGDGLFDISILTAVGKLITYSISLKHSTNLTDELH